MTNNLDDKTWAQIPALSDNYIYFIIDETAKKTAVIDPSDAAAVMDFLQTRGLELDSIFITHHHHDHVGGVVELQEKYKCPIHAPQHDIDKGRIPHAAGLPLTGAKGGDEIKLWGEVCQAMALPGHTLGHVGFYFPRQDFLFSADVIFSMGCGFLFEGDYDVAYESLQKINTLPPATLLFMAHEYSAANIEFAKWFWGDNAPPALQERIADIKKLRLEKKPTVPVKLELERAINPFLQMQNIADFQKLREAKNNFSTTMASLK